MGIVGGIVAPADTMSAEDLVAYARRLEKLGYDSMWMPDMFGREIYVTAAHLLAKTSRLRVASGIAHIYGRDAIATAQAARTLTELSGGRFILGLGVSHPIAAEMRGVPWEKPVAKMRGYLEAMRKAPIHPAKLSHAAPVYIAAHAPGMLRLAAELADGVNTYLMPPAHTAHTREVLGKDKRLNVVIPCCLCSDADRARKIARKGISMYLSLPAYRTQWLAYGLDESDLADGGSDRLIDTFVAWGDEKAIRAKMREHLSAGADEIEVIPYATEPDRSTPWDLLEALAAA